MACLGHMQESMYSRLVAVQANGKANRKLKTARDCQRLTQEISDYLATHPNCALENKRVTFTIPSSGKEGMQTKQWIESLRCDCTCENYPDCVIRVHLDYPEFCYYKKPKRVAGGKNV